MSNATYDTRGSTAVITLDSPPVNSLGYDVRVGIVAGLDRANADPAVKAIVLIGRERAFSGAPTSASSARRRLPPSPTC